MTPTATEAAKNRTGTRLIENNDRLRELFAELGPGDYFIGRLRLRPSEENLLIDLLSRGITLFPSGLSQVLCRSKVMQATIYGDEMLPGTTAVHDLHDLLALLGDYGSRRVGQVVTKKDRENAGLGINLWNSLEEVFNQASLGGLPFPFVVQPFADNCRDIRAIILGDYREAYWRDNPDNFRNNLHFGGRSSPVELEEDQLALCHRIMARGSFPYAHIDLMVTADHRTYLSEINLRGGIRGAMIEAGEYRRRIDAIHDRFRKEQGL